MDRESLCRKQKSVEPQRQLGRSAIADPFDVDLAYQGTLAHTDSVAQHVELPEDEKHLRMKFIQDARSLEMVMYCWSRTVRLWSSLPRHRKDADKARVQGIIDIVSEKFRGSRA